MIYESIENYVIAVIYYYTRTGAIENLPENHENASAISVLIGWQEGLSVRSSYEVCFFSCR
jgi:hypothetical protein